MSSRSLRTAEREPTSYHLSSLWAELEALLESVLLLDWLDEYGASWLGGGQGPDALSVCRLFGEHFSGSLFVLTHLGGLIGRRVAARL